MRADRRSATAKKMWRSLGGVALAVVLALVPHVAHSQNAAQRAALARLGARNASTVSASGTEATNFGLNRPGGLAFDSAGNLYIADTDDNIVCEVALDGTITTVAGTGEQGFAGDGGPAISAELDAPVGVAVDAVGNLYIADTHNQRIREVAGGNISTIAGTGVAGFAGDGNVATAALLNHPTAIAVDSKGNIYIADTENHRIRKIVNGTISTVAGNGDQTYSGDGEAATAAGLDSPNGVAVDSSFNIYIGDTHNQRVRMVTASTGIISTLAGTGAKTFTADGAASSAALARPRGVAVDASGNVYVADSDNHRIRMIANNAVTTVAGDGTEGFSGDKGISDSASLDTPRAVAALSSSVAFADTNNDRVRTASGGVVNTIAGSAQKGVEQLSINGPISTVYGTGRLTATFSNNGQTGTGTVTFYDGSLIAGTGTLGANSATLDTSHLSAGTHSIVAVYGGDANNAAVTSGVYVLVVSKASATATLTASSASSIYGLPLTLNATVASSTVGLPSGTVNFYSGSTLLNSAPLALNNGAVSFTTTAPPIGASSLTAVYSGDTNFATATSVPVALTVISPDFTLAGSTASQTLLPSHSISYAITLTPQNGSFVFPVALAASGLPPGVTASFSPSTIASGIGATTTTLTLTASANAGLQKSDPLVKAGSVALAFLLLPLTFGRRVRKAARGMRLAAFIAVLLVLSTLSGCGGGGGFFLHSSNTYNVTISATSGPQTHTTTVSLTLQ